MGVIKRFGDKVFARDVSASVAVLCVADTAAQSTPPER
jgi:hypothetical protein